MHISFKSAFSLSNKFSRINVSILLHPVLKKRMFKTCPLQGRIDIINIRFKYACPFEIKLQLSPKVCYQMHSSPNEQGGVLSAGNRVCIWVEGGIGDAYCFRYLTIVPINMAVVGILIESFNILSIELVCKGNLCYLFEIEVNSNGIISHI